jgi:hypothetical protein
MLCSECLSVNSISACAETLEIGNLQSSTPYKIYFQLSQPKKILVYEAISAASGLLVISLNGRLRPDKTYTIWVTEATAKSMNENEDIEIPSSDTETEIACCIEVHTNNTEATTQQLNVINNCTP